ncbi:MAG TPA: hypothetical protein VFO65_02410, partial [Acidimicrobiales bacterium]|nr:hypothetical protein [Acidimicrobiales bacterium]
MTALVLVAGVTAPSTVLAPRSVLAAPCNTDSNGSERAAPIGDVAVCSGQGSGSIPGEGRGGGRRYSPEELVTAVSQVDGLACTIQASRTSSQGQDAIMIQAAL